MEVHFSQAVLVAVFHETLGGINHEDACAGRRARFIEDNETGRNPGAIEEIGRQADDALRPPEPDR